MITTYILLLIFFILDPKLVVYIDASGSMEPEIRKGRKYKRLIKFLKFITKDVYFVYFSNEILHEGKELSYKDLNNLNTAFTGTEYYSVIEHLNSHSFNSLIITDDYHYWETHEKLDCIPLIDITKTRGFRIPGFSLSSSYFTNP